MGTSQAKRQYVEQLRAECHARGWGAGELARGAGLAVSTAESLLAVRSRSTPQARTLEKAATALGLAPPSWILPSDEDRPENTTIGTECSSEEVDIIAARYTIRQLWNERMPGTARALMMDIADSLGLPESWTERPLKDFGA